MSLSNVLVSSDPHLFHENIFALFKIPCPSCVGIACAVCGGSGKIPARPFTTVEDMHRTIVERHNAVVTPQDHWYCLGDVTCLRNKHTAYKVIQVIRSMNGHKRLILGNHDHFDMDVYKAMGFQKIKGSHKIDNLLFTHYPVHESSIAKGCVNVHGHIHTQKSPVGPYINVSVEALDYTPIHVDVLKVQAETLLQTCNA